MRSGSLIDLDVLFIVESNEFLAGELCVVVCDDRVRYSEVMDDVEEELHGLFGLDHGDRPILYLLDELVHGDEHVHVAPGCTFEGPDQIKPLDREWPRDRDRLERLGR